MSNNDGGETAHRGAGEMTVQLGEAFDLLRSPRRRWMLHYLTDQDGTGAPLQTIAEHVHERQGSHDGTADKELSDVYVELYHTHVPRLDRAGIASYDQEEDTVSLEVLPRPVPELLEVANELERSSEND